MPVASNELRNILTFDDLIQYLEEKLDWPLHEYGFDELTFEYLPEELGLKDIEAAKIGRIHQLRPLSHSQPWGIFFVEFEKKKLPVVVLRRILSHLVLKKRASANKSREAAWDTEDLLFITAFGEVENEQREIAFAHFHQTPGDLPTLRVLGWDGADTPLKLAHVDTILREQLLWPDNPSDLEKWRQQWRKPFKHRIGHVISTASTLAEVLAVLARGIRDRALRMLSAESENGPLRKLHKAFQTSLVHDLTEENFADTYAQTITYGLLTAAIARTDDSKQRADTFVADNLHDLVPITNPFLREMLQTFLIVGGRKGGIDFDELGIQDVVDLLRGDETDLPAILRDFGNRTRGEDPVIHFYEHFLAAYNKKLKVQRGAFYTPQPVVSYIIRSVHELLQIEFGLEDGLASTITWGEMKLNNPDMTIPAGVSPEAPFVMILDIATGTGTFLVEVIDVIHKTMTIKWQKQGNNEQDIITLWNKYVPKHLLPRLYGYELMMAPYAIAHMKIGLKLFETGYLFMSDERVRIYLTNALEPASDIGQQTLSEMFPALAHEAQAVNEVKRSMRFTVVVGNPPYSRESANRGEWIMNLMKDYKKDLNERNLVPLDDDYIKFIRLGQYYIDNDNNGILAYISANSFIDGVTHRQMRKHLLESFHEIYVLNLHGNATKKEVCPDGSPDQNVFDIMTGVSINVFVKTGKKHKKELGKTVSSDLFGKRDTKYQYLLENNNRTLKWFEVRTTNFEPWKVFDNSSLAYNEFISLLDLFIYSSPCIRTHNDGELISFEKFNNEFNQKYLYKVFDYRFINYDLSEIGRSRIKIMKEFIKKDNFGLIFQRGSSSDFPNTPYITKTIADQGAIRPGTTSTSTLAPIYLYPEDNAQQTIEQIATRKPNLNQEIIKQIIEKLGLVFTNETNVSTSSASGSTFAPIDILDYIYAVLHSPHYREKYKEFLNKDFPKVPYPQNAETFWNLVKLGGELRQIHLLESPIVGKYITAYFVSGDNIVRKVKYQDCKVFINDTQYFAHVPQIAWDFYIGGYRPAQRWLKDRKGRALSEDDINHYHHIVVALSETIRIMAEIDKVIDARGGWPAAFQDQQKT